MNEDEQVIWGQPVSFQDFVQGFQVTPNQRRVELVPKADPQKFYTRKKVASPSQNQGEIRDANKERVNRSLSNYASNNFLLSTSNIRPDQNGRYNPGLGQFAGDQTALALSMGFDPFNASNYYKVATQIPKFRNWGLTRLLANELNNEVRVAGELGKNVGNVPTSTNNLFRATVYKGGEITDPHSVFFTTDPKYASNYGKVTPYTFESKNVVKTTEPLMGYSDPVNMDMFVYNNTRSNPKATAIIGNDKVTGEFIPSQGMEILSLTPRNFTLKSVQEPKTSLRFFERPQSRISEAERAGIPKGERAVNDPKVLENAKQFAEKYGYEVPTTIEGAKNMYKTHNRFFRSINMQPFEKAYPEFGIFPEKEFPELVGLTKEEKLKTLASKGYPKFWRTHDLNDIGSGFSDDFVFVSPSLAENAAYANSMGTNFSNTVMLQRPFSFGKPTEWHINADWRPSQEVYGRIHRKGEVSIGNSPLKNEAKISTKHLIPVKLAQPGDQGTALGDFLYKQNYKGTLPF